MIFIRSGARVDGTYIEAIFHAKFFLYRASHDFSRLLFETVVHFGLCFDVGRMPKVDAETEALQKELTSLAEKCREEQKKVRDSADLGSGSGIPKSKAQCRKSLKGHINKVTCVHFSGDSRHAVSGSLDGKLIVWDCYTGNKTMVIPLRSAWVMTAVFAPSGNFGTQLN